MTGRIFLLLLAIALLACGSETRRESHFFPFDSLLDAQTRTLVESKATMVKTVTLRGDSSQTVYQPADTTAWQKEFEVFYHLDAINKPVNRTLYKATDSLDVKGGGMTRSWRATEEAIQNNEVSVHWIDVDFLDNVLAPTAIRALVTENNLMFRGTRLLELGFDTSNGASVLSSFSVRGGQDMFLSDSVEFTMKGKINIPR